MEINDEIPSLPELSEDQVHYVDFNMIVKELESSQNIFMVYESDKGEIRMLFDKLSGPLYACMVTRLSQPHYSKIYEFLKLVLEAVYQVKKVNKKGYEMVCKIESFIKEKNNIQ